VRWHEFEVAAPELAADARRRFGETRLALLGTVAKDGWPRISPCEVYVVDGELLLGMIWQSKKALDLVRDPRLVVHSAQCDPDGADGDVKLYGRAVDMPDPVLREHYADRLEAQIDWRPTEPFHLFALDVERAGFVRFGKEPKALRWDPQRGVTELPPPG
jgi:pyridoxamine 5'-phosphate oxidase-like protein